MYKKIFAFVLILTLVFPMSAFAATSAPKVYLDGVEVSFPNKPVIVQGTTMVPFRNIFEALGVSVSFDSKSNTISSKKGDTEVRVFINQTYATKNGEMITLSIAPYVTKGVTYVPLRFVGQSFGYKVAYKNNTIYIDSPTSTPSPSPTPTTTPSPSPSPSPTTKPSNTTLTVEEVGELANRVALLEVYDAKGKLFATGSGVSVAKGEILTNYHVIEGGSKVGVTFEGLPTIFTTTTLLKDEKRDLALLKIDNLNLPIVDIGDSKELKLGESIVAIGSPLGFSNTLTVGNVSNPLRKVNNETYVQISAPIDSGSSGGALFNMKGKLVGIITAKMESSANLNFAIPSSDVISFLKKTKKAEQMSSSSSSGNETSTNNSYTEKGATEVQKYLNYEYATVTLDGFKYDFEWIVMLSKEKDGYLVGGIMEDSDQWLDLMDMQDYDDMTIPSILYWVSDSISKDKGAKNAFVMLYLDTYVSSYPSAFPSDAIEREGSGYRLFYNFAWGTIDGSEYVYSIYPEEGYVEYVDI